ncbi:MAG: hypothetical protein J1F12_05420 [Muribaculaceae bacterium]|nr:hypothetical protein [Muribaculaceae bacterium]
MVKSLYSFKISLPLEIHKLNWHAIQYAFFIALECEKIWRLGLKSKRKYPYPPCVNIAQCLDCGNMAYCKTLLSNPFPSRFHYPLKSQLQSLGKIGSNSSLCNNVIGKCSEPNAVNKLIGYCNSTTFSRLHSYPNLNNIQLSASYRPRTLEWIERCPNCSKIFGNETY